jgi:Cyclin
LSYLSRIHKYCPTTYEVFLSLLVYFDRMTERVNAGPMLSLRQANQQSLDRLHASQNASPTSPTSAALRSFESHVSQAHTPPNSGSSGRPADMASASAALPNQATAAGAASPPSPPNYPSLDSDASAHLSQFFVVDSFNIHRLVIAGVTCASKFFSDIFYTNSRYAKVSEKFDIIHIIDESGWRTPVERAQSPRASIFDPKRFQTGSATGRDGGLWNHVGGVLCTRGSGTAASGCGTWPEFSEHG